MLIEVLVVTTIAMVALSMLSRMVIDSTRSRAVNLETAMASRAVQNLIERMHNQDFFELYALYNRDPEDDPDGPGTAPGAWFDVGFLRPIPEWEAVGLVRFPEKADPAFPGRWRLREDEVERDLGMPRDLDLDGKIDALDHASDYSVLPFVVEVHWLSASGRRQYRVHTMLSEMRL